MSWISDLARPDIVALKAYEHAAWEPGFTRLHANELPCRATGDESIAGLNRYPQPQPKALLDRLAQIYQVPAASMLVTRGSDEAIDLLVRAFCRAGLDGILLCPPTFGMYAVAARIQGAHIVRVRLRAEEGFALDAHALLTRHTPDIKLVFLCSPNNPTGNLLDETALLEVIDTLARRALVILDEAYLEFSTRASLAPLIQQRPHVAVLRTLSKAHGLAGARLGALIADPEVIALLRKVIAPYAIPQLTLEAVLGALSATHLRTFPMRLAQLRSERQRMCEALQQLSQVERVHPSETNFLLVRFKDAAAALARAKRSRLLVRDISDQAGLDNALRVTIGTRTENNQLLQVWR